MRVGLVTAFVLLGTGASAQEFEVELSFFLQPDGSGSKTENRFITLEDGELELEAHNSVEDFRTERDATAEEIEYLVGLVKTTFSGLALEPGPSPDYPYIEVQVEFDGDSVEAEVEYDFAPGQVPVEFIEVQKRFFAGAFQ